MSEHTEGPWKVTQYPNKKSLIAVDTIIPDADGITHQICGFEKGKAASAFFEIEQHLANAHLIAAAPDLLEVCVKIVEIAPKLWGPDKDDWPRIMNRVEAVVNKAIAKAEVE